MSILRSSPLVFVSFVSLRLIVSSFVPRSSFASSFFVSSWFKSSPSALAHVAEQVGAQRLKRGEIGIE